MAKRRPGRPKGTGTRKAVYCTVRLDKSLVGMLKAVATREGIIPAEWLSRAVRPILEKAYVQMVRIELEGIAPEVVPR